MKVESGKTRPGEKKGGASDFHGVATKRRRLLVAALILVCVSLATLSARADYYNCYQSGNCAAPALSNASDCVEGTDYNVNASNFGSRVTVLAIHGGGIEPNTSQISAALSGSYGWNLYDFNAHGSTQCPNSKLHITATSFDDARAVALVGASSKAVAIHGYADSRGYAKGIMCVGGADAGARGAFISYVNGNSASWSQYTLTPLDAPSAGSGACGDLTGTASSNIVNRTSSGGGLQLELNSGLRADLANTSNHSYDALRGIVYGAILQAMGGESGQAGCVTVANAGQAWQNAAFAPAQTGSFTLKVDAVPLKSATDAGVGLSNGAQTTFSGLACAARFSSSGNIDARNGGGYSAASTIPYTAGRVYHFRFAVNIPSHTYSLYVTPEGGTELLVGQSFAFRTEQSQVTTLNNYSLFADAGSAQVCNFGAPSFSASAQGGWANYSFARQTGSSAVEFDATPSASQIDGVMGLSDGAQTSFANFACLMRFNQSGTIDARNGSAYQADASIAYTGGATYHFRVLASLATHKYSVFVTPPGGPERQLGLNYGFRTEQQSATGLGNFGLIVDSASGAVTVGNLIVNPSADRFGTTELYPTIPGGREWASSWDNNHPRTLNSHNGPAVDPDDPEFHARGDAGYSIDGAGIMTTSGPVSRLYVYDSTFLDTSTYTPASFKSWNNVEVTFYGLRVGDDNTNWGGLVAGAKIRHIPDSDLCGTRGYYGRIRNDGGVDFEKEINHGDGSYDVQTVAHPGASPWPSLPYGQWVGYKLIARAADGGTHVKLELWRDTSDGAVGGRWERLHWDADTGGWGTGMIPCAPGRDPAEIIQGPNLSVFIRNDGVSDFRYKKWTIREIAPQ